MELLQANESDIERSLLSQVEEKVEFTFIKHQIPESRRRNMTLTIWSLLCQAS